MPTLRHAVTNADSANAASITATGITPIGSNRFGIVKVGFFQNLTINSVVWGGVDITANLIKNAVHDGLTRKRFAWFYYLNPPTTTENVVVSMSGSSFDRVIIVEAWDDVDQVTPYEGLTFTADGAAQGTDPATLSVSSSAGRVVSDGIYIWGNQIGASATATANGTGQTEAANDMVGSANGAGIASSYIAGAGSVTFSWDLTNSASYSWCMYAISLRPASVAIDLDGTAGLVLSATGALQTAIALSGSAGLTFNATGNLNTAIALAGLASLVFSAAGDVQVGSNLSGTAGLAFSVTGQLQTGITLAGSAGLTFAAAAELATAIRLAGASQVTLTAAGNLLTAIPLSGSAGITFSVAGNLLTAIALSGSVAVVITSAANLQTAIQLGGAASVSIFVNGDLVAGAVFQVNLAMLDEVPTFGGGYKEDFTGSSQYGVE